MSSVVSYKFIIIGASGVGKTAILKRLIDDTFSEESQSTIGVEFDSTVLQIGDKRVKLQIWDTAGQERFRSISKAYYRNAVGVILVFDLTDRKSFEDLSQWIADVHQLCDANAAIQLIGNKADLIETRAVTIAEAEAFAKHHQTSYIETSAKSGQQIREAFMKTTQTILNKGLRQATAPMSKDPLMGTSAAKENNGCC